MWFSGYNGCGQLISSAEHMIKYMRKVDLGIPEENENDLKNACMSCTWSYNAVSIESKLYLSGCIRHALDAHEVIPFDYPIKRVCATDKYCLVLLADGDLYKVCVNSLERCKLNFLKIEQGENVVKRLPIFPNDQSEVTKEIVTDIASCETFSVALTCKNVLYSIPSKVYVFPKHVRVVKMCAGAEHVLILTANGDVYAFGSSSRGQLGLGTTTFEEKPILVEALAGIKITDISCGYWHSAAISAFGDLYAWGWNVNGQLGRPVCEPSTITFKDGRTDTIQHKMPSVFPVPEIVDLPNSGADDRGDELDQQYQAHRVRCGSRHTVVSTTCGRLLSSGWNKYGQCAVGDDDKDITAFTVIDNVPCPGLNFICGSWNTILY